MEVACKESSVDSPGLVDFAIGLVNAVFNLPDGKWSFLRESNKKNCEINSASQEGFGASFSLPEWQAIKMIFFASCASFISKPSMPFFSCKIASSHNASVLDTFYSE